MTYLSSFGHITVDIVPESITPVPSADLSFSSRRCCLRLYHCSCFIAYFVDFSFCLLLCRAILLHSMCCCFATFLPQLLLSFRATFSAIANFTVLIVAILLTDSTSSTCVGGGVVFSVELAAKSCTSEMNSLFKFTLSSTSNTCDPCPRQSMTLSP